MSTSQVYVTSLPAGQGYDAGNNGYKVTARTPGLSDTLLNDTRYLAEHFGQHSRYATVEGWERENQWRETTADLAGGTPLEVLKLFAPIFSYFRYDASTYILSRTQYYGIDYSGRQGNFFSHLLVLDPTAVPVAPTTSPVSLMAGGLLSSGSPSEPVDLSAIASLPPAPVVNQPLAGFGPDIADFAPDLIGAIADARCDVRPVIIVLPSSVDRLAFLHALFLCLPPRMRFARSCCTLEYEYTWTHPQPTVAEKPAIAGHDVLLMATYKGDPPRIDPSHYDSPRHTVFNFLERRYPPRATSAAFLDTMKRSLATKDRDGELGRLHKLADEVGLIRDLDDLDKAAVIVRLRDAALSCSEFRTPFEAIAAALRKGNLQLPPLESLLAHQLQRLFAPERLADLLACAPALSDIVGQLDPASSTLVPALASQAAGALSGQNFPVAKVWLEILGPHGHATWRAFVQRQIVRPDAEFPTQLPEVTQHALLDIALAQLSAVRTALSVSAPIVWQGCIHATLALAATVKRFEAVWTSHLEKEIDGILVPPFTREKSAYATALLSRVPAGDSSPARISLTLFCLQDPKADETTLCRLLGTVAPSVRLTSNPGETLGRIQRAVEALPLDAPRLSLLAGVLFHHFYFDDFAAPFRQAFRAGAEQGKAAPGASSRLARTLAERDFGHYPARLLIDRLASPKSPDVTAALAAWLKEHAAMPGVLDALFEQLLCDLTGSSPARETGAIVRALVALSLPDSALARKHLPPLLEWFVADLPLWSGRSEWLEVDPRCQNLLSPRSAARYRVSRTIRLASSQIRKGAWSFHALAQTHPTWRADLALLGSMADAGRVETWLLRRFGDCGFSTVDDVAAFHAVFHPASTPATELTATFRRIGRDLSPLTWLLSADRMIVWLAGATAPKSAPPWCVAMLAALDKSDQQQLARHLLGRIRRSDAGSSSPARSLESALLACQTRLKPEYLRKLPARDDADDDDSDEPGTSLPRWLSWLPRPRLSLPGISSLRRLWPFGRS